MKALVLAGGGAKGSYQIGVWKALQEIGWQPDIITGTSVGSLNGALFTVGAAEQGEALWMTLTPDAVADYPEDWQGVEDLVKGGGLDVTPLAQKIEQLIKEQDVRNSPIRFGLVTVELGSLWPHELSIDEIPEGLLTDYLLASSACFPAFRPREINGVRYIDGGYSDNMPFGLAARMGADELLCVDINGIGINRLNMTGLPTTIIESRWDLGGILAFSPERAQRNIRLGWLDTLRTFGRYQGEWYAMTRDEAFFPALGRSIIAELEGVFAGKNAEHLVKILGIAEKFELDEKIALPSMEAAARHYHIDPTQVYTPAQLADAVLAGWQNENKEHTYLDPLFASGTELTLPEIATLGYHAGGVRRGILCRALERMGK